MEGFREPHPSQMWLVDSFFRLHRRRPIGQYGILPIPYVDMVTMADDILRLPEQLRDFFFKVMESADDEVIIYESDRMEKEIEKAKNK